VAGKGEAVLDLEAEYNNRARCPDHPAVMARWKASAKAAREAHPPVEIAYGDGTRERMDLFSAGEGRPVAVFLHGGYWQALDKSWFSGVASALLAQGVGLAVPNYDLAPSVRLGAILRQVRAAVDAVRALNAGAPPLVFGHSAGGHMAAAMLSEGRAGAALAISGVFDLTPLIPTTLNTALDLDAAEALALSVTQWPVPASAVLDCLVGGDESAEFIRQSRDMAADWAARGVQTRFEALAGLDHFTVLDPLFDADSAVVRRLVKLAGHQA
jgi:arylformamidase